MDQLNLDLDDQKLENMVSMLLSNLHLDDGSSSCDQDLRQSNSPQGALELSMQQSGPSEVAAGAGQAAQQVVQQGQIVRLEINNPTTLDKQALLQLLQLLQSPDTSERQQQIVAFLKANSKILEAFIKQRQLTQFQPGCNCMRRQYLQQPQMQPQQQQQLRQQLQWFRDNHLLNLQQRRTAMDMEGNLVHVQLNVNSPTKQTLQQLTQALQSPHSPEHQQQVLAILKANPKLMKAFIIMRREAQLRNMAQISGRIVKRTSAVAPPHLRVQEEMDYVPL